MPCVEEVRGAMLVLHGATMLHHALAHQRVRHDGRGEGAHVHGVNYMPLMCREGEGAHVHGVNYMPLMCREGEGPMCMELPTRHVDHNVESHMRMHVSVPPFMSAPVESCKCAHQQVENENVRGGRGLWRMCLTLRRMHGT